MIFVYFIFMPVTRPKFIKGPGIAFVTTTVREWKPLLRRDIIAEKVLTIISNVTKSMSGKLYGYVIMPHHIHILVGLPEIEQLNKYMKRIKSLSSRTIKNHMYRCSDHLFVRAGQGIWKRRFDDVIIFSEKQFIRKLNYIHNNPVKAGFVGNSTEWKYSSAGDWSGKRGLIEVCYDLSSLF